MHGIFCPLFIGSLVVAIIKRCSNCQWTDATMRWLTIYSIACSWLGGDFPKGGTHEERVVLFLSVFEQCFLGFSGIGY